LGPYDSVQLAKLDVRIVLQCLEDVVPSGFRHVYETRVNLFNGSVLLCAVRGKKVLQIGFIDARSRLYQEPAWHRIGGRSVDTTGQCQRQNNGEKLPDGFKDGENASNF